MSDLPHSVPVAGPARDDETGVFRASTHPSELVSDFLDRVLDNGWDLFLQGKELAGSDATFLGTRLSNDDGYTWKTYAEVYELSRVAARSLSRPEFLPVLQYPSEAYAEARSMRLVGFFSANREELIVLELAANLLGVTLVPFYDALSFEALNEILKETSLAVIFCSGATIDKLALAPAAGQTVKTIVCFDPLESVEIDVLNRLEVLAIRLVRWSEFMEAGLQSPDVPELSPAKRENVSTICYTSGTTGTVKGVIVTHGNIVSTVCAAGRGPMLSEGVRLGVGDTHLSYLPMAHIFERIICNLIFSFGGRIGFFRGDIHKVLDDMAALRPTVFVSVPRIYMRVCEKIEATLAQKPLLARAVFSAALRLKIGWLRFSGSSSVKMLDDICFHKMKCALGGRVRYLLVGGAKLEGNIQEKLRCLFGVPMVEGYGLTESMGASFVSLPWMQSGQCGAPLPCVEFKLRSVEELGFRVTDPQPRGELMLRGPAVFPGYFMRPTETAAAIDSDGWFKTGDVALLRDDGCLKIIDRVKEIFKLSQGEYVAPSKLENVYSRAPGVLQICVLGNSGSHKPMAVVHPCQNFADEWQSSHPGEKRDLHELCEDEEFLGVVRKQLADVAESEPLKGFERLGEVHLVPQAFSPTNGLLTPTHKLRRKVFELRFGAKLGM